MAKKKKPFIILSVIFGLLTILTLYYTWGKSDNITSGDSMMDSSMGNMTSSMHLKGITIRDLIIQTEQPASTQTNETSHESHHSGNSSFLKNIHKITTITIVVLIPFIIAGTIFLFIIWFNRT